MIRLEQAALAVGGRTLLQATDWHLRPGEKVGLVGRNGTGKTTLLRALQGELEPMEGRVVRRSRVRVGWLPQHVVMMSERTVWDEAREGMTEIEALKDELQRAEAQASEEGGAERLASLTERLRVLGGFAQEERIGTVLDGLGFGPKTWSRPCVSFSGGWQMRIALGRLLLSEPDLMLLDEPSNHLDLGARSWLGDWLKDAAATVLFTSHDRHLLDRVVDRIVEIRHQRLHVYVGTTQDFLRERALRQAQAEAQAERTEAKRQELQAFVDRFGAKATKASQAQSRQKQLDRLETVVLERDQGLPTLRLASIDRGPRVLFELRKADLGYPGHGPVLSAVDLALEPEMRVAVVGPNGAGKSTLLKALEGALPPLAGRAQRAPGLRWQVFHQDLASRLPSEPTALEWLTQERPADRPQVLRAALGALGLSGPQALQPMGTLSGGERSRVALARLALEPAHLLLLDEPTNHLDVETAGVLEEALREHQGALVLVSHDRHLLSALATHVCVVRDGRAALQPWPGSFDLDWVKAEAAPKATESSGPSEGALSHDERRQRQRALERATKEIAHLQRDLERLEGELVSVDAALVAAATDPVAARSLGAQRLELTLAIDRAFERWQELETLRGQGSSA